MSGHRFGDWLDCHEFAIDRGLFWLGAAGVPGFPVASLLLAMDGDWWNAFLCLVSTTVALAIAVTSAEDLAYRRGDKMRPYQRWMRCVRRWVHVALWGWSA